MSNWYEKSVIASNTAANQEIKFAITDTKLCVLVVTPSTMKSTTT